jgi:hypothetical protein
VRSIKDWLNIGTRRKRNRGTLWASVQARRVIEIKYRGSKRSIEPFALGITRYGNPANESLFCYQARNYLNPNEPAGWRRFQTSDIRDIIVSAEQFEGDRPGYDPDHIDMVKVFCCVRPERPAAEKVKKTRDPPPVSTPPPGLQSLSHNDKMRRFRDTHVPV